MAIDRTEVEAMRAELGRMIEAHRRVLDQLATGVAIFNVDRKLTFYNTAFRSLFELDADFLDQTPTDSAVLDRLRSLRKLPEEQDFRLWKQQLYEAYRAVEPQEHMWHLPDGRTLRVVTTPNPEGGVTYLYDDVTESLDMHRRYDALIKVQSETLDHLAEAVAVFGSDGRVRLHNPAFQRMWRLAPEALDQHPHAEEVTAWCQALHDDGAVWRTLRAAVTAIDDREPIAARIERRDGMTIDMATMPLPDGATLVTFQDVSDTVNVERALRERNEALEAADEIKIEFVHHVSYELRSPLTNIIGFAHFLNDPAFGPLTDKQHEYLGYITNSTNALLALINNILDLATIDAGAMTLNLDRSGHPRQHGSGGRGRAGPAGQGQPHARHPRGAQHRQFHRRRAAAAADPVQSLVQRGRLLAAGRDRHAQRRAAARCRGIHGRRPRPRHPARIQRQSVRLVRDRLDGLGPPRHRIGPVAGTLLRAIARRQRDHRFHAWAGHHGVLHLPDRAGRQADSGVTPIWPAPAMRRRRANNIRGRERSRNRNRGQTVSRRYGAPL